MVAAVVAAGGGTLEDEEEEDDDADEDDDGPMTLVDDEDGASAGVASRPLFLRGDLFPNALLSMLPICFEMTRCAQDVGQILIGKRRAKNESDYRILPDGTDTANRILIPV